MIKEGTEVFLIRLVDGPGAGKTTFVNQDAGPRFEWPLPARLCVLAVAGQPVALFDADATADAIEPGREWAAADPGVNTCTVYTKRNESQSGDAVAAMDHVARGAEYVEERKQP